MMQHPDAAILEWVEEHLVSLRITLDSTYKLKWLDEDGFLQATTGLSLKDCIQKAMDK